MENLPLAHLAQCSKLRRASDPRREITQFAGRSPMVERPGAGYAGAKILVVGLGRFGGGVGVTRWLAEQGASLTVTDSADPHSLADSVAALAGLNPEYRLGGHGGLRPSDFDLVVFNPAVRKDQSPLFQDAERRAVPWTTELNLFCERCRARVIGITGSYGKSTTCAMLAHVLERSCEAAQRDGGDLSGRRVHLGGNIGRSLLSDLPHIQARDVVVLEISNAQLEDLPRIGWTPHLAAITNLFPHHLDRYSGFDGYIAAKLNIVAERPDQRIVVGDLHPRAQTLLSEKLGQHTDRLVPVGPPRSDVILRVPGRHNRVNATCAAAIARQFGLDDRQVVSALSEFHGLPHRLEFVGEFGGATYINDSKSTAPPATMMAVEAAMEMIGVRSAESAGAAAERRRLVVVLGGQDKGVSFDDCAALLARNCRQAVCVGQSGPAFADAIARAARASAGCAPPAIHLASDLPAAVSHARIAARPGDLVLYSPGAPSFDQYVNFAERGQHFVDLVRGQSHRPRTAQVPHCPAAS